MPTIRLSLQAAKLKSLDTIGKSDPMIVLHIHDGVDKTTKFLGQTEWKKNERNPRFSTTIQMEYDASRPQIIIIQCIDVDHPNLIPQRCEPTDNIKKFGDLIGMAEIPVTGILHAREKKVSLALTLKGHDVDNGIVTITGEDLVEGKGDVFVVNLFGRDLLRMDGMFRKSDPYLKFMNKARTPMGENVKPHDECVCKTQYIKQSLNPDFEEERIPMKDLCAGTITDPFIIQVWDYDTVTKDDFMGMVETSVAELLKGQPVYLKNKFLQADKNRGYLQLHPEKKSFVAPAQ